MLYFKAKMRQIRFPLRFCPRPRWGSLQCPPISLLDFRGPTSKEREGMKDGREGQEAREEGR